MIWTLIFIINIGPLKYDVIGYFPSYENCHEEHLFLVKESHYFDKWACVQLPKPKCDEQEVDNGKD